MLASEANAPLNCLDSSDVERGKDGLMLVHTSDTYSDSFHCEVHSPYNSNPEQDHRIYSSLDHLLEHHRLSCYSEVLQGFVVH